MEIYEFELCFMKELVKRRRSGGSLTLNEKIAWYSTRSEYFYKLSCKANGDIQDRCFKRAEHCEEREKKLRRDYAKNAGLLSLSVDMALQQPNS